MSSSTPATVLLVNKTSLERTIQLTGHLVINTVSQSRAGRPYLPMGGSKKYFQRGSSNFENVFF